MTAALSSGLLDFVCTPWGGLLSLRPGEVEGHSPSVQAAVLPRGAPSWWMGSGPHQAQGGAGWGQGWHRPLWPANSLLVA